MEGGRNKHARRCSSLFRRIEADCAYADVGTLVGSFGSVRGGEVAQKYPVDWDATDGRNGGAQQRVWEILMEIEGSMARQKKRIKELEPWFWIWRRHPSGSVFLWSGLGQRTSASQGRYCESCAGTSSTRGVYSSKDVGQSRSRPSWLSCQGRSGAAGSYGLCCVLNEVTTFLPSAEVEVFVGDSGTNGKQK